MILVFSFQDLKVVLKYLGVLLIFFSLVFLAPLIVALCFGEYSHIIDFLIGFFVTINSGLLLLLFFRTTRQPNWIQGTMIVGMLWLVCMFLAALPLYLSGHYGSYLDACFEAMSGFATTGLTLSQDLETMALSMNFFRHLLMFVGGQGIIIVALSILFKPGSSSLSMYYAEARQEQIAPGLINTARFIWKVSLVYFLLGTAAFWLVLVREGFPLYRSLVYSMCTFMACFDTGGFAPFSQNIAYYHSFRFEIVACFFMILGAMNFALHYALWHGRRREILFNMEARTFLVGMFIMFLFVGITFPYNSYFRVFREGFFLLLSAHSGTGFSTVLAEDFFFSWHSVGIMFIIVAMSFGGGICSTTGGIKLLRIGVLYKTIKMYIKQAMSPPYSYVGSRYHHLKSVPLEEDVIKSSFAIFFLFVFCFFVGTVIAMLLGYETLAALFESVSATCNVGLSSGITSPLMPATLKVVYILQMWLGRLEFIAVIAIIYYFVSLKWRRRR